MRSHLKWRAVIGLLLWLLFVPLPALAASDTAVDPVQPRGLEELTGLLGLIGTAAALQLREWLPQTTAIGIGVGSLLMWLGPRIGPRFRWIGFWLCTGTATLYSFVVLWPLVIYWGNRAGVMSPTVP